MNPSSAVLPEDIAVGSLPVYDPDGASKVWVMGITGPMQIPVRGNVFVPIVRGPSVLDPGGPLVGGWTSEDEAVSAVLESVARSRPALLSVDEAKLEIERWDMRASNVWTRADLPWLAPNETLVTADREHVGRLPRLGVCFGVLVHNERGIALARV